MCHLGCASVPGAGYGEGRRLGRQSQSVLSKYLDTSEPWQMIAPSQLCKRARLSVARAPGVGGGTDHRRGQQAGEVRDGAFRKMSTVP
jgi:hypothetical protein